MVGTLKQYSRGFALIALVIITVTFGIVGAFSRHEISGASNVIGQSSCASHCLSHTQPATNTSAIEDLKKDDYEPSPPHYSWLQTSASILLLYTIAAILAFWLLEERKRMLLTTQLRI